MARALHASRWLRLGRLRPAVTEPDPADLGTAFGLDLSLRNDSVAPARADKEPGWLERLGLAKPRRAR